MILPIFADTLCEMEITVLFSDTLFSASSTSFSVSASRFAVISSNNKSFGLAAAARAMDKSCHCPCENSSGVQMVITADYQKRWHITALLEEQSQKMTGTTMLSVPATTAQLIIICTGQPEKQTKLPIHLRYFIRMNQN